jgi:hypothetical protein
VDEAVNRYARELIEAINAAVAGDPVVRACRERAKAAGFDLEVSLDAAVRVTDRSQAVPAPRSQPARRRAYDITEADRRFLRSLRIAAEETSEAGL